MWHLIVLLPIILHELRLVSKRWRRATCTSQCSLVVTRSFHLLLLCEEMLELLLLSSDCLIPGLLFVYLRVVQRLAVCILLRHGVPSIIGTMVEKSFSVVHNAEVLIELSEVHG